jgi:UDP-N-acetylmuramate dehydrogenase
MKQILSPTSLDTLRRTFGERLQENVVMANYTTAHVGGPADAMLILHTCAEMEEAVRSLWRLELPFYILGAGSNVLVRDSGLHCVVLVNRARNVRVDVHTAPPTVWAESGANLGGVARQVALRGLSGLEWAASVPGTVGGAVYGNAGANGGDTQHSLALAEILHPVEGKVTWPTELLQYAYRTSLLKRSASPAVILSARFNLAYSTPQEVQARMDEFAARRRRSQPPGASMGSMFKNPPGDYAGRLIEAAGLKGARVGGAEISPIHANFFVNQAGATASDVFNLIKLARERVYEQSGIQLELEIELLGDLE